MDKKGKLSIVVPIYNEFDCIDELISRLVVVRERILAEQAFDVEFIFVDDGSSDGSVSLLSKYAASNECIKLIRLSRNFGHQIAVTAGVDHAFGDYVCIIDADLQDPPELIPELLHRIRERKVEVLYCQRRQRSGESKFKLWSAATFYRLLRLFCDVDIPVDTGDFRIFDQKVAQVLRTMRERRRFLRGMVPWVGFSSEAFVYDRHQRFAGETKYPLARMLKLAANAVFSFSYKPLRLVTHAGAGLIFLSMLAILYVIMLKVFTDAFIPGVASILILQALLSGFIIAFLGIVGEYVGRIFEEIKERPIYAINDYVNFDTAKFPPSAVVGDFGQAAIVVIGGGRAFGAAHDRLGPPCSGSLQPAQQLEVENDRIDR